MKFYSEELGELFDTEKELVEAEDAFKETLKGLSEVVDEVAELNDNGVTVPHISVNGRSVDLNEISKQKKLFAKEVERAEQTLEEAYANYALAQEQCKKIIEDSNNEMVALLEPAREAVEKAERDRLTAIKRFNKEFGPFKTTYSGDRALKEFYQALDRINSPFGSLFFKF